MFAITPKWNVRIEPARLTRPSEVTALGAAPGWDGFVFRCRAGRAGARRVVLPRGTAARFGLAPASGHSKGRIAGQAQDVAGQGDGNAS